MSHAANEYVKHLRVAPNGAKITPGEKAVLSQLADDHNQDKGFAWPSVGNLAMRACMTERHCRRLLRELEAKGVVQLNPRLRENGGRSSSEYRFCQIDPPFDPKLVQLTAKRMQLQMQLASQRPQQTSFLPPDTDVRGGRTSGSGGGGQREQGEGDTDVRGAGTPMSGQEPLFKPKTLNTTEPLTEPEKQLPLPPQGGGQRPDDRQAWNDLYIELKSELQSIAPNIAKAKGFTTVKPSEGSQPTWDNDFEICFREWWLKEARRLPNGLVLITEAGDYAATQQGLEKYRARLERLAQKHFLGGMKKPVCFKLLGATPQKPAAPPPVNASNWTRLCVAVERELGQIANGHARNEAMQNFRAGTEGVRLAAISLYTNPETWTLHCPNPKKTAAILGMFVKHVRPAAESVAGRRVQFEFRPISGG